MKTYISFISTLLLVSLFAFDDMNAQDVELGLRLVVMEKSKDFSPENCISKIVGESVCPQADQSIPNLYQLFDYNSLVFFLNSF